MGSMIILKVAKNQCLTLSLEDTYLVADLTAQKMKFSIKDFSSKCDQIRRFLQIWSHLLKKSLMENFIFCVVSHNSKTSSILVRQLKFFKKMVVSSVKFTTSISWSPICMPIIFVLTSIKVESTSATIMLKNIENGQS